MNSEVERQNALWVSSEEYREVQRELDVFRVENKEITLESLKKELELVDRKSTILASILHDSGLIRYCGFSLKEP